MISLQTQFYAMGYLSNSEKGLNKLAALKDIRRKKRLWGFCLKIWVACPIM